MKKSSDKEAQFIPGIFNYCDWWCEHCPMTGRCRVYADAKRKKAEHIRKGEDPYHWNIVVDIGYCNCYRNCDRVDYAIFEEERNKCWIKA